MARFWRFWEKAQSRRVQNQVAALGGILYLGPDLDAGVVVDREAAMEISALVATWNVLVQSVGQIPIGVFQATAAGPRRDGESRFAELLRHGPNAYQTRQDWVEQIMLHLLGWGDYYATIGRVGFPQQWDVLHPVENPASVFTELVNGRKLHTIDAKFPRAGAYAQADMFHIHGPSPDGYTGRDFCDTHRQTLSLARAIFRHGARFYANGAMMSGILILPPGAKPADLDAAKTAFLANYGGDNVHQIAAYSHGTDFKPISVDPEKAQALASRQQVAKEIAALWGVPLWRLYGEEPPTDEARVAFYCDTLGPWFERIAANVNKQLLPADRYCKFITAAFLRGDIAKRYTAYRQGIEGRFLLPNEVREWEDMPPYDGGDAAINPYTTKFDDPAKGPKA